MALQTLEVKASISSPIITEAMKWALLISLARQLGVSTNDIRRKDQYDAISDRTRHGINQ